MKLNEIPKQLPRSVADEEIVLAPIEEQVEASSDDEDVSVYGLDKHSPDYARMKQHLKILKRTDPTKYKKIVGLS